MQSSFPSYRFARRVSRGAWAPVRNPGDVVFVEDSFEILLDGQPQDFRELIDEVVGGTDRRWTPGDPYARYLPSGAMVSVDETEALLATAPVRMRHELSTAVSDEVLARRSELSLLLQHGVREKVTTKGYASCLAAFVGEDRATQVAARFAQRIAPAMMLLLDLSSTPGVLLRASGPRVEIVTEHIEARDDLRAAMTFFLGGIIAIEQGRALPELDAQIHEEAANGGFLAQRDAFGDDVFVNGRMACLDLANGGTILAGSLFGEIWGTIRPLVASFSSEPELALIDDLVSGATPLPCERDSIQTKSVPPVKPVLEFASIVRERRRGAITVTPASVTWDSATLSIGTSPRTVYARVKLEEFESFAKAFDRGRLDKPIMSFSRSPSKGRVASGSSRTGLYDLAEIPIGEASHRLVRIGETSALERSSSNGNAGSTLRLSKRIATYVAAAAMFAGTATFAFTGLRQPELQPARLGPRFALSSAKPSASASVLARKQVAQPTQKGSPSLVPTLANTRQTIPSGPNGHSPGGTSSNPTPTPAPTPTQTSHQPPPSPAPTPTQTPTPTPTPTHTGSNSQPVISGNITCGVGTSSLSFTVTTDNGAPELTKILVEYSGVQEAMSPTPSYPTPDYQGSANAAVTVNSSHRWTVSVQDQSNRNPVTVNFTEGTNNTPKCT